MRAVEGIKTEVDRQRRFGRTGLIATAVICVIIGIALVLLSDQLSIALKDILAWARTLVEAYRYYVMIPIAVCAVVLGLIAGRRERYYN